MLIQRLCLLLVIGGMFSGCEKNRTPRQEHEAAPLLNEVAQQGSVSKWVAGPVRMSLEDLYSQAESLHVQKTKESQTEVVRRLESYLFNETNLFDVNLTMDQRFRDTLSIYNEALFALVSDGSIGMTHYAYQYVDFLLNRCSDNFRDCKFVDFFASARGSRDIFFLVGDLRAHTNSVGAFAAYDFGWVLGNTRVTLSQKLSYTRNFLPMAKILSTDPAERDLLDRRQSMLNVMLTHMSDEDLLAALPSILSWQPFNRTLEGVVGRAVNQSQRINGFLAKNLNRHEVLAAFKDSVKERNQIDKSAHIDNRVINIATATYQTQNANGKIFKGLGVKPFYFSDLQADDEWFMFAIIDGLFRSTISTETARHLFSLIDRSRQVRLVEMARAYADSYIAYGVTVTTHKMKEFFEGRKYNYESYLNDAIDAANRLSPFWLEMGVGFTRVETFLNDVILTPKRAAMLPISEDLRLMEKFIQNYQKTIVSLVTMPLQIMFSYEAARIGWEKTIFTFAGSFTLNPSLILRNLMEGKFEPWMNFHSLDADKVNMDAAKLNVYEIVTSFEYAFRIGMFDSFNLDMRDFFFRLYHDYLDYPLYQDIGFPLITDKSGQDYSQRNAQTFNFRTKFNSGLMQKFFQHCEQLQKGEIVQVPVQYGHVYYATALGGLNNNFRYDIPFDSEVPFASTFLDSNLSSVWSTLPENNISMLPARMTQENIRASIEDKWQRLGHIFASFRKAEEDLKGDTTTADKIKEEVVDKYNQIIQEPLQYVRRVVNEVWPCMKLFQDIETSRQRSVVDAELEYMKSIYELVSTLQKWQLEPTTRDLSVSQLKEAYPDSLLWDEKKRPQYAVIRSSTMTLRESIEEWLLESIQVMSTPKELYNEYKAKGLIAEPEPGIVQLLYTRGLYSTRLIRTLQRGWYYRADGSKSYLDNQIQLVFQDGKVPRTFEELSSSLQYELLFSEEWKLIRFDDLLGEEEFYNDAVSMVLNPQSYHYHFSSWLDREFSISMLRGVADLLISYYKSSMNPFLNEDALQCEKQHKGNEAEVINCQKGIARQLAKRFAEDMLYLYEAARLSDEDMKFMKYSDELSFFGDSYSSLKVNMFMIDDDENPIGYFDYFYDLLTSPFHYSAETRRRPPPPDSGLDDGGQKSATPEAGSQEFKQGVFQRAEIFSLAYKNFEPIYGQEDGRAPFSNQLMRGFFSKEIYKTMSLYKIFAEEADALYQKRVSDGTIPTWRYYRTHGDGTVLKSRNPNTDHNIKIEFDQFFCRTNGYLLSPMIEDYWKGSLQKSLNETCSE